MATSPGREQRGGTPGETRRVAAEAVEGGDHQPQQTRRAGRDGLRLGLLAVQVGPLHPAIAADVLRLERAYERAHDVSRPEEFRLA